jgi:hypothetical protein
MAFELPPLPYDYDALAPYMSRETLEYHHDKHHQAYVTNGNNAIKGTEFEGKSLEEIVKGSFGKNPAVFNNAGQHFNHLHFWQWMKPNGGGAVPGALALLADPLASLVDTAFIGHIGPVELAAVGVSIAVFNQVSRIAIFPLVSVTTSFVAEEDATSCDRYKDEIGGENEPDSEMDELIPRQDTSATSGKSSLQTDTGEIQIELKRKNIPSVSTALLLGGVLGLVQTVLLVSFAKPILGFMGVKADSEMLKPALQYLVLRSLGAPAVLLSLATQGVFRGLKDTKTPFGWRCDKHCFRSDIYVCVPVWCKWSSCCSCYITILHCSHTLMEITTAR